MQEACFCILFRKSFSILQTCLPPFTQLPSFPLLLLTLSLSFSPILQFLLSILHCSWAFVLSLKYLGYFLPSLKTGFLWGLFLGASVLPKYSWTNRQTSLILGKKVCATGVLLSSASLPLYNWESWNHVNIWGGTLTNIKLNLHFIKHWMLRNIFFPKCIFKLTTWLTGIEGSSPN